jgi:hypothetical protein
MSGVICGASRAFLATHPQTSAKTVAIRNAPRMAAEWTEWEGYASASKLVSLRASAQTDA